PADNAARALSGSPPRHPAPRPRCSPRAPMPCAAWPAIRFYLRPEGEVPSPLFLSRFGEPSGGNKLRVYQNVEAGFLAPAFISTRLRQKAQSRSGRRPARIAPILAQIILHVADLLLQLRHFFFLCVDFGVLFVDVFPRVLLLHS